ncbi:MAG: M14 metallopeptidase family protein [Gemmatimonadaceae bacterium]
MHRLPLRLLLSLGLAAAAAAAPDVLLAQGRRTPTPTKQPRRPPPPRQPRRVTPPPPPRVTSPLEEFGRNIGDDYFLVNYTRMIDYWQKLDGQSGRMKLERIGTTAEGRPMWMAIITAPENHRRLAEYQRIARQLALAENLTDSAARALAARGKAVVWIDGGLHATEVLGAQQLIQMAYELVSGTDPETLRFLRDDIVLLVPANPDGQDLVSDWYMREPDTLKRTTARVPRLYQKYIGHDNNRDSYMASQPETQAMDSILYRAWFPQILYNHHQTGPPGTVLFAPPFRDPFNYNYDPLIPAQIELVGAAMHNRLIAEGKPGATMREGATYSTWWNGGVRTTAYFHNIVGLLTETIGHPTPMEIPLVPERLLPKGSLPMPIQPQKWRFAQSLAYAVSANRAVLDVASRYRETFLYNIYQMGRNSIKRGSTDTWTISPRRVTALQDAIPRDTTQGGGGGQRRVTDPADLAKYASIMRNYADRDPRGYIIPSDQRDFLTATKFANALIRTGIVVQRATAPFTVGTRTYPANSLVVKTAQAFRPHVLDMFEPQDHPNDFPYPGGPPTPPYDNAGWTLAYQMGIEFDRILDPFGGPFVPVAGYVVPPPRNVAVRVPAYALSHSLNDAFTAVNRLLARGESVFSLNVPLATMRRTYPKGTFYIPARASVVPILSRLAADLGISFEPLPTTVGVDSLEQLRIPRVALWDQYGGTMTSGWGRFLLEQFEFPYEVIYPPAVDAGVLTGRFDVLILPDGASFADAAAAGGTQLQPEEVPEEFRNRVGRMTVARTIPQIRAFLEAGGTVLAIGSATAIGVELGLPIANALVDSGKPLPRSRFYVPGSILSMRVDTAASLARGLPPVADVYYDNSPGFRLLPGAEELGIRRIGWFDTVTPLRSGWAWGQRFLNGVAGVVQAPVGEGMLVLYGPDPYFRFQPHGTFKLLFNGILYRTALGD